MADKEKYDDDTIAKIDKAMGWVEEDGSCPSNTARELGMHCKFLGTGMAWHDPQGIWSHCVLGGSIQTTLLAKSFISLERSYQTLVQRRKQINRQVYWQNYYSAMWERRYCKWICKQPGSCECQLCRMKA